MWGVDIAIFMFSENCGEKSNKYSDSGMALGSPEDDSSGGKQNNGAPTSNNANKKGLLKGCKCKKTECLKRYCDCFAAGAYCSPACSCQGCQNRAENKERVLVVKKQAETLNPLAFHPKIAVEASGARHRKGCNCRKSMCEQKYCECYAAGVACSNECRCDQCKNPNNRDNAAEFTLNPGDAKDIMDNATLQTSSIGNDYQVCPPTPPPLSILDTMPSTSRARLGGIQYPVATNYVAPPNVLQPQVHTPLHLSGNNGNHVPVLAQPNNNIHAVMLPSMAPPPPNRSQGNYMVLPNYVHQEQRPNFQAQSSSQIGTIANQPEALMATATQQQQQHQHQAVVNPQSNESNVPNGDIFEPQNDVAADSECAYMFSSMMYSPFFCGSWCGPCGNGPCGNPYHHRR